VERETIIAMTNTRGGGLGAGLGLGDEKESHTRGMAEVGHGREGTDANTGLGVGVVTDLAVTKGGESTSIQRRAEAKKLLMTMLRKTRN